MGYDGVRTNFYVLRSFRGVDGGSKSSFNLPYVEEKDRGVHESYSLGDRGCRSGWDCRTSLMTFWVRSETPVRIEVKRSTRSFGTARSRSSLPDYSQLTHVEKS